MSKNQTSRQTAVKSIQAVARPVAGDCTDDQFASMLLQSGAEILMQGCTSFTEFSRKLNSTQGALLDEAAEYFDKLEAENG